MQTNLGIVPVGDRILVLRDRAIVQTEGGLVLPEAAQEKPCEGTVIALGTAHADQLALTVNPACPVRIGDRVIFSAYTGMKLDVGSKEDDYLVMRPDELLAVRRSAKAQGSPVPVTTPASADAA